MEFNIQFCSYDELLNEDKVLVDAAIKATGNSYAKYSNFNVGGNERVQAEGNPFCEDG